MKSWRADQNTVSELRKQQWAARVSNLPAGLGILAQISDIRNGHRRPRESDLFSKTGAHGQFWRKEGRRRGSKVDAELPVGRRGDAVQCGGRCSDTAGLSRATAAWQGPACSRPNRRPRLSTRLSAA